MPKMFRMETFLRLIGRQDLLRELPNKNKPTPQETQGKTRGAALNFCFSKFHFLDFRGEKRVWWEVPVYCETEEG